MSQIWRTRTHWKLTENCSRISKLQFFIKKFCIKLLLPDAITSSDGRTGKGPPRFRSRPRMGFNRSSRLRGGFGLTEESSRHQDRYAEQQDDDGGQLERRRVSYCHYHGTHDDGGERRAQVHQARVDPHGLPLGGRRRHHGQVVGDRRHPKSQANAHDPDADREHGEAVGREHGYGDGLKQEGRQQHVLVLRNAADPGVRQGCEHLCQPHQSQDEPAHGHALSHGCQDVGHVGRDYEHQEHEHEDGGVEHCHVDLGSLGEPLCWRCAVAGGQDDVPHRDQAGDQYGHRDQVHQERDVPGHVGHQAPDDLQNDAPEPHEGGLDGHDPAPLVPVVVDPHEAGRSGRYPGYADPEEHPRGEQRVDVGAEVPGHPGDDEEDEGGDEDLRQTDPVSQVPHGKPEDGHHQGRQRYDHGRQELARPQLHLNPVQGRGNRSRPHEHHHRRHQERELRES